jgi:hypothetical protein
MLNPFRPLPPDNLHHFKPKFVCPRRAVTMEDIARKTALFNSLDHFAPGHKVKKNLTLAALSKAVNDAAMGAEFESGVLEKRVTGYKIGKIVIDDLVKRVIRGRDINDIMNADQFAELVQEVPHNVADWTTQHMQTVINTIAGRGQVARSPTGNVSNQRTVLRIQEQLYVLVCAHRAQLAPIFDPVYVVCHFSNGSHDSQNQRGPPAGWLQYIARLQNPAAQGPGQPVWPLWLTAPPAAVAGADGVFVFDQGMYRNDTYYGLRHVDSDCILAFPGTPEQQMLDAQAFQSLVQARFGDEIAVTVVPSEVFATTFNRHEHDGGVCFPEYQLA